MERFFLTFDPSFPHNSRISFPRLGADPHNSGFSFPAHGPSMHNSGFSFPAAGCTPHNSGFFFPGPWPVGRLLSQLGVFLPRVRAWSAQLGVFLSSAGSTGLTAEPHSAGFRHTSGLAPAGGTALDCPKAPRRAARRPDGLLGGIDEGAGLRHDTGGPPAPCRHGSWALAPP